MGGAFKIAANMLLLLGTSLTVLELMVEPRPFSKTLKHFKKMKKKISTLVFLTVLAMTTVFTCQGQGLQLGANYNIDAETVMQSTYLNDSTLTVENGGQTLTFVGNGTETGFTGRLTGIVLGGADQPADPTEPGIGKEEIIQRYVEWFGMWEMFGLMAVAWVFKFLLKRKVTEEEKKKIGRWIAIILFVPTFVVSLAGSAISGGMGWTEAIAIFGAVVMAIGLHTVFVNPLSGLFKEKTVIGRILKNILSGMGKKPG